MTMAADRAGSPGPPLRRDHQLIVEMVETGARVLDVGCEDGRLLELLAAERSVRGRGVEISREGVNKCVAKGLSVIQGDADRDLVNYPDGAFDYAILSQTIQATRAPRHVIEQLLRIGRHVVVSFPNFGHWLIRAQFAILGRMPVNENLPHTWYETPNIHFCTIKDFQALCEVVDARVERAVTLDHSGRRVVRAPFFIQNLVGSQAVFLLSRAKS